MKKSQNNLTVSKLVFERYEAVKKEGKINMLDYKNVCLLAEISRGEYFEIIQHYGRYKEEYG